MYRCNIKIGETYHLTCSKKEGVLAKVLNIDNRGNCSLIFEDGEKDIWHCSWLKELK